MDAYREKLALQKQKNRTPDFSHLTPIQLKKGVEHVIKSSLDRGIPPDFIIHRNAIAAEQSKAGPARTSSLPELPARNLDAARNEPRVLLPSSLQECMGNHASGQDNNLRRTGTSEAGRRSRRNGSLSRIEGKDVFDFGVDSSNKPAPQERKQAQRADVPPAPPRVVEVLPEEEPAIPTQTPVGAVQSVEQQLCALVIDADPYAKFILPDLAKNEQHTGRIVQASKPGEDPVFMQSKGQGTYIIHHSPPPADITGIAVVIYKNGQPEISRLKKGGRGSR